MGKRVRAGRASHGYLPLQACAEPAHEANAGNHAGSRARAGTRIRLCVGTSSQATSTTAIGVVHSSFISLTELAQCARCAIAAPAGTASLRRNGTSARTHVNKRCRNTAATSDRASQGEDHGDSSHGASGGEITGTVLAGATGHGATGTVLGKRPCGDQRDQGDSSRGASGGGHGDSSRVRDRQNRPRGFLGLRHPQRENCPRGPPWSPGTPPGLPRDLRPTRERYPCARANRVQWRERAALAHGRDTRRG